LGAAPEPQRTPQQPNLEYPQHVGVGFSVFGDYLYWKGQVEGIEIGYLETPPAFLTNNGINFDVKTIHQPFKTTSGYRVGAGYHFEKNDWNLRAVFTDFTSKASRSVVAGADQFLTSFWGVALAVNQIRFRKLDQNCELKYRILDGVLDSGFFRYKEFQVHPMFGIRGAWIDIDANQDLFVTDSSPLFANGLGFVKNKSNFSGVGLVAGTLMEWHVWKGFSLFADISGSFVWGNTKVEQAHLFFQDAATFTSGYTPKENYERLLCSLELCSGAEWKYAFQEDKWGIFVKAGYDMNIWFDANPFRQYFAEEGGAGLQFSPVSIVGNLILKGLTLRAGVDF